MCANSPKPVRRPGPAPLPHLGEARGRHRRDATGRVSNLLHASYNKGDIIDLAPPFGDFWLHEDRCTLAVLISGGVGVTSMIAMLKHLMATAKDRQVQFIHACRSAEVQAFGARVYELGVGSARIHAEVFSTGGVAV